MNLLRRIIRRMFGVCLSSLAQNKRGEGKIFIPFSEDFDGGPATFMGLLKQYIEKNELEYTSSCFEKISHVFFPIEYDVEYLRAWKRKGLNLIQRLDGVYYRSQYGEKAEIYNKNIKEIYKNLATTIIFQSEYSRKQCFDVMGNHGAENASVIINGTNKDLYYPLADSYTKESPGVWRFISTGNFREAHMIEPTVNALDKLWEIEQNFTYKILGSVKPFLKDYFDRPYIKLVGSCEPNVIAEELRESDLFIYSFLNPNCPNSIIEAISTGLPVVGFCSGAMDELCHFQTELLAFVSNDVVQCYEEFSADELLIKIQKCMKEFSHWKKNSMDHAHLYDANDTLDAYMNVIYAK